MWTKICFRSHFYANFHASVTLPLMFAFLWTFHQNVDLRNWELYIPFLEVFCSFLKIYSAPNQALENPCYLLEKTCWCTSMQSGAQWLSGRVLDSRPKGRRRHCVVSLSKNINPSLVLVQPRKTRPFITERLLMGCKESNQTNKQTSMQSMIMQIRLHFCTVWSMPAVLAIHILW